MRSPTIADLPAPPPGRTGWPWTDQISQMPAVQLDGSPWPRISIVTPSYNQGAFIEETIRSILLQGYPDLEYFIFDGGSTDDSVEIIRKYERWITYWVSEADNGQASAINNGLMRCTGLVFNWINSDDLLTPGALESVACAFAKADAVVGPVVNFSSEGTEQIENRNVTWRTLVSGGDVSFHQPGVWLCLPNMCKIGLLPEDLNYCFDSAYLVVYFYHFPRIKSVTQPLVLFRLHGGSKTMAVHTSGNNERSKFLRSLAQPQYPMPIRSLAHRVARERAFYRYLRAMRPSEGKFRNNIVKALLAAPLSMWKTRFLWGWIRKMLLSSMPRN